MAGLRCHVRITGVVQGVGFRPFIQRLASSEELSGWVRNVGSGVDLEVEGKEDHLKRFLWRIESEKPAPARIERIVQKFVAAREESGFRINGSLSGYQTSVTLAPDLAACSLCLSEILDPSNRRFGYPFTTCTLCGPRYTIAENIPFDRVRTSMRHFEMCDACRGEFESPGDRRFHSQTNCCHLCGPALELRTSNAGFLARSDDAIPATARALRQGRIVALKGVGGFHLLADAANESAIGRLRVRKNRGAKPLALLMASVQEAERYCFVSRTERGIIESPAAPIVLLEKRPDIDGGAIADSVAPGMGVLGVMLAYTPIHHLLLKEFGGPLVATSANRSDEPICFDDEEAFARIGELADVFLTHNREIIRGLDDSLVREIGGRGVVLRRGRGYAPGYLHSPNDPEISESGSILAYGGHLKNSIALSRAFSEKAQLGPHIGNLDTARAVDRYHREISEITRELTETPSVAACDLHPGYASSIAAGESGSSVVRVQHHYAHVLSCLADNGVSPPALGVAWDGSGYGLDGTVWGGEFLAISGNYGFERVAHLSSFRLPGGNQAIREPRRAALGLLYELMRDSVFSEPPPAIQAAFGSGELKAFQGMLSRGLNSPVCSSVGRLFDAVAALLGLRHRCDFEGQAAMELEALAWTGARIGAPNQVGERSYRMRVVEADTGLKLDWSPMVAEILDDIQSGCSREGVSLRFHRALVSGLVEIAGRVDVRTVALTGGVFQNRFLAETAIVELRNAGFLPIWHRDIPPGDGGLAIGQLVAARRMGRA